MTESGHQSGAASSPAVANLAGHGLRDAPPDIGGHKVVHVSRYRFAHSTQHGSVFHMHLASVPNFMFLLSPKPMPMLPVALCLVWQMTIMSSGRGGSTVVLEYTLVVLNTTPLDDEKASILEVISNDKKKDPTAYFGILQSSLSMILKTNEAILELLKSQNPVNGRKSVPLH